MRNLNACSDGSFVLNKMMINYIQYSFFLTTVTYQLSFIWLTQQHSQCPHGIRNYRESLGHQYWCIHSRTLTCMMDTIEYSQDFSFSLSYFCGFVNGRNTVRSQTIWKIYVRPNIHIYFIQFSLLHNYWFCDYEYVKVVSNNKNSTFCGSLLPWVYDASDSSVKIIFETQRFSSMHYHMELQYYGAYINNHQHILIFTQPLSNLDFHLPHAEQIVFESLHLVSKSRRSTLQLTTNSFCHKHQMVCYDGPGIKSPIIKFLYIRSAWKCMSSTFQMLCKILRPDRSCSNAKVSHLQYHVMYAREDDFSKINVDFLDLPPGTPLVVRLTNRLLRLDMTESVGTTKYIAILSHIYTSVDQRDSLPDMKLTIKIARISFPYMMYEGNSCMYGGIYLIRTSSEDSGLLSHCTPSRTSNLEIIVPVNNLLIIIIHYSSYSAHRITFEAMYERFDKRSVPVDLMIINIRQKTATVKTLNFGVGFRILTLQSYLLNLRKIQYFKIILQFDYFVKHLKFNPEDADSCIYCTVSYFPHRSNIKERQPDAETLNNAFERKGIIQFVFINMSSCGVFTIPTWSISLGNDRMQRNMYQNIQVINNSTYYLFLSPFLSVKKYRLFRTSLPEAWFMVHIINHPEIPDYAIWRVWIDICHIVSHVSFEVPTDKYQSTSVYRWNHYNNRDDVYMTVDEAVNILVILDHLVTIIKCQEIFAVQFVRHFFYDDRITQYVSGEIPELSFFTFHNIR